MAEQLRRRGHDVEAVLERSNLIGKSDVVIFSAAQSEGRVIVTEKVPHFRALAATALIAGRTHYGLVFTTNRSFPRSNPRTPGRMVTALGKLLSEDSDLKDREFWLA